MQFVDLYQTLEDRNNEAEVMKHGPYCCKRERPIPWLGVGYYFWESDIKTAKAWASKASYKDYYICHTSYDYYTHNFFDLAGNPNDMIIFRGFFDVLKEKFPYKRLTVPFVLEFAIKELGEDFYEIYKAIRARSEWKDEYYYLPYPTRNTFYNSNPQIQICVIDLDFLKTPFVIVEKSKVL